MNDNQRRSAHFLSCLGVLEKIHPIRGGTPESPFTVLEISPSGASGESGHRVGWTYITNGMSQRSQPCQDNWVCPKDVHLELMLYCRKQSDRALKTLEELANFPYDAQSCLAQGQVLPTDEPTEFGFTGYTLMSPHREEAQFSPLPFEVGGHVVHVLWVFPLLPVEVEFGTVSGSKQLEKLLQSKATKPFHDLARKAVVTKKDIEDIKKKLETEKEQENERAAAEAKSGAEKKKPTKRKGLGLAGIFGRDKAVKAPRDAPVDSASLPDPAKAAAPAKKEIVTFEQAEVRLAQAKETEASAAAKVRGLREDIHALQESLRKLRTEIKAADEKRSGAEGTGKELDLSLTKAKAELAAEEQKNSVATKELDEAKVVLDSVTQSVKAAEADLTLQKGEKSAIQDSLIEIGSQATEVSEKQKSSQVLAEETEKEASELVTRAEELRLQAEAAATAAEIASDRANAAQAALEEQKAEFRKLSENGKLLRGEMEKVDASIERATTKLEGKTKELTEHEEQVAELTRKTMPDTTLFDELTKTVTTLTEELASAFQTVSEAGEELKTMRSSKSKAVVEEQTLDSKIQNALLEADQAKSELDKATKVYERLEADALEAATKEADAAQAKVEEMMRALEQAKEEAERTLQEMQGKTRRGTDVPAAANSDDARKDKAGSKSKRLERLQIIKDSMIKDKEE